MDQEEFKRQETCPQDTRGACKVFPCASWRHASCSGLWTGGRCLCDDGTCAMNGVCVNKHHPLSFHVSPSRPDGPDGVCKKDVGGDTKSCSDSSDCPKWSNAQCVAGSCVCPDKHCAVIPSDGGGGQCVNVSVRPPREATPAPANQGDVTLILSGGGAKGAFEVGMLEGLCESPHLPPIFKQWTKIFGISIGALNAAGLSQFPPSEQCTRALDFLRSFWTAIKTPENVFVANRVLEIIDHDRKPCLSGARIADAASSWWETGGFCDPSPGTDVFEYLVHSSDIRTSGMALRVGATNVNTGNITWFTEKSPDIIDGALASGRLAPALQPSTIGEHIYIDGGYVSNTPILQALFEGAETVLVLYLNPSVEVGVSPYDLNGNNGLPLMEFAINLVSDRYSTVNEARNACRLYRDAHVLAYIPEASPGGVLEFTEAAIARMMKNGYEFASNAKLGDPDHPGLYDLCDPDTLSMLEELARKPQPPLKLSKTRQELKHEERFTPIRLPPVAPVSTHILGVVVGAICGAFGMFFVLQRGGLIVSSTTQQTSLTKALLTSELE